MTKIKNLTFINSYDVAPHDYCNRMIARFEEIANNSSLLQTSVNSGTEHDIYPKRPRPSPCNDIKHERGIVSMARAAHPDSADSQFFICYDSHPFLDGKYTAWGKVIQGMNIIDRIPEGRGPNGQVLNNPTKIITMRVK